MTRKILFWVSITSHYYLMPGQTLIIEGNEIKHFIETGVKITEDRSSDNLTELIDENYVDDKGLGKIQLTKLARF